MASLDKLVEAWFLEKYGHGAIVESVYDAGNGVTDRIAEVKASQQRLRADREVGLYDGPEDSQWFRERYVELSRELRELENEPQRPPGMVLRPTGETVEARWRKSPDVQARKEILMDFGVRVTVFPASSPVRWVPEIIDREELAPGRTVEDVIDR
ncbi:hypothetical protein ACTWP5_17485 [Streptomyces sp. 4N509B]|uniref:hypothetical protein n=1 Tax=Streptomyces sp. 4N509B TaxID=3457413 RepID=UPI003FD0A429